LTNEQFADSNYYLGFLFTLISLATSLCILSSNMLAGGLLTSLIGQFGVSISTTIAGLSMRIYLLSFAPNIGSNIESFNLMIMEKLQMLNDHIGHSIDQTKTFSNVIDDKVNLFIEQTLKSVEQYNERLVDSLDQNSINNIFEKIYDDMDLVHQKQEERVAQIYKNISEYHSRYEEQTQASITSFQTSIKDSDKWIKEFNDSMGASAGSIANSNTEMRKVIHNFDGFVRELPKIFSEVNGLFEKNAATLTADLEAKNRQLLERFIEQKDLQNKILIERLLGENQKVINSFIESGDKTSTTVIEKLNVMNEAVIDSFIQSREAGNEKMLNEIMVQNNKVISNIGSKAEDVNAEVVKAIMNTLSKSLTGFIGTQDQKNEQLIQKMIFENRRLLESVITKMRPVSNAKESLTPSAEKVVRKEEREAPRSLKEKMQNHGSVKLPKG